MRLAGALLAAALGWGAAAGAAPLAATEVAPGVFVYRAAAADFTPENGGGIANLAFVVGKQSVAVIDSGGSLRQGRELLDAVRARTPLAVSHVIDPTSTPITSSATALRQRRNRGVVPRRRRNRRYRGRVHAAHPA